MSPRVVAAVVLSLLTPGLGHGLAGARGRMLAWAAGMLAATTLAFVSVWLVPVTVIGRALGSLDAYRALARSGARWRWGSGAVAAGLGALGAWVVSISIDSFVIPSTSMAPTLVPGDRIYVDTLSRAWRPPTRGELIVFRYPCGDRAYVKRVVAVGGDTVELRCGTVYLNGAPVPATLAAAEASYRERDEPRGAWVEHAASRYAETLGGVRYQTLHHPDRPSRPPGDERGDFPRRDRPFSPTCRPAGFYERDVADAQPVGALVETRPAAAAAACAPQLHLVVPRGALFVLGDNRDAASDSRAWGLVAEAAVIGRAIGIWASRGPDGGWSRLGAIE